MVILHENEFFILREGWRLYTAVVANSVANNIQSQDFLQAEIPLSRERRRQPLMAHFAAHSPSQHVHQRSLKTPFCRRPSLCVFQLPLLFLQVCR